MLELLKIRIINWSFHIDDDKLLEKYKTILIKIGNKKMLNSMFCLFMLIIIWKLN